MQIKCIECNRKCIINFFNNGENIISEFNKCSFYDTYTPKFEICNKNNSTSILFSINDYDSDGDINEEGIFLHFNNIRIKVGKNIEELYGFINNLYSIAREISEN